MSVPTVGKQAISKHMAVKESYWYRFNIWIVVLALSAYAKAFSTSVQNIKDCSMD